MSEYQYYEWQTIDRALTAAEQTAVNGLSSHIDVTSTRAWVEYHWGDFKHEPKQVLARYFDAFLYYANWGCQRLAFRFPKGLLDENALQPYLWEYCSELEPVGDCLILDISFPDEDGGHWFEGETRLSALAPLRDDILAGDFRALYLAGCWPPRPTTLRRSRSRRSRQASRSYPRRWRSSCVSSSWIRSWCRQRLRPARPFAPRQRLRWRRSSPACHGPSATRSCAGWPQGSRCWR